MNRKSLLLLMLIISALQGCSLRHEKATTSSVDLVYRNDDFSSIQQSSIGVFSSASSGRIGVTSAQILYEELLRDANGNCYRSVQLASSKENLSIKDIFAIARQEKYDVVIVTDVSSAIEGSDLSYSSVSARMRVFRVNERDETLIMTANDSEKGDPTYPRDLIFFKTKAEAAPLLFSLVASIANRFARTVCVKPEEQESNRQQADPVKEYATAPMVDE
jgi:hypothetical protein